MLISASATISEARSLSKSLRGTSTVTRTLSELSSTSYTLFSFSSNSTLVKVTGMLAKVLVSLGLSAITTRNHNTTAIMTEISFSPRLFRSFFPILSFSAFPPASAFFILFSIHIHNLPHIFFQALRIQISCQFPFIGDADSPCLL